MEKTKKYIKIDNKIIEVHNPEKKHIIYESTHSKKYLAFNLIEFDLNLILEAINEIKNTVIKSKTIEQALTSFIIITYGKCFRKGKMRGFSLNKDNALKFCSDSERELHNHLLALRDTHIAHSDSNIFTQFNLVLQFEEKPEKLYSSILYMSNFNQNIEYIEKLVLSIKRYFIECADAIFKKIKCEIDNNGTDIFADKFFIPDELELFNFNQIKDAKLYM